MALGVVCFVSEARALKDVRSKEIKAGEGKTVEINDEKLPAYMDDTGQLHVLSSICTHIECVVYLIMLRRFETVPATVAVSR